MKWALLIYEISLLAVLAYLALHPDETTGLLVFRCGLAGGAGGAIYCLRGLYLNVSVRDQWDDRWAMWHLARPIVSVVMGVVAYVLIRAGLLVLEAEDQESSTQFGYLAVAFVAGLNVDNFIKKIESLAETTFGIGRSRTSKSEAD